jgi:hypothetical protein
MIQGVDKAHCIVLKDGKFDTDNGTDAGDLNKLFDAIQQHDGPVVLHFHGGLINKADGLSAANVLKPIYQGAGAYPVFFVWESGWQDVIENNLPTIFKEPIFQKILARVTQFAKGKVDKSVQTGQARAVGGVPLTKESEVRAEVNHPKDGREPYSEVDPSRVPEDDELTAEELKQFQETLQADVAFDMAAQQAAAGLVAPGARQPVARSATVRASTATLMDPQVLDEVTVLRQGSRSVSTVIMIARAALILTAIIKRFAQRRDHGFYLTIIEEIFRGYYVGNAGRFLWDGMKQDITDSFGVAPECGGTPVVTDLDNLYKSGKKPRITLVGHSAGAIYVCRLLQEIQSRGVSQDMHFNVIFIAPACDFNLLAKTIQSCGGRIDGLRVFGMGDDLERKNAIVKVVYPSSLLYFVSGVIEKEDDCPLVGMQRYYSAPYDDASQFADIDSVKKCTLFQKEHALIWALSTAGEGFNCDMISHGGWATTKTTVASVVHIIQKGYDFVTGARY